MHICSQVGLNHAFIKLEELPGSKLGALYFDGSRTIATELGGDWLAYLKGVKEILEAMQADLQASSVRV